MSYNLSRTLFYEFYKSDPNFIYESVEEYRNYKSDPNFANKSLEEYRIFKASQAIEKSNVEESADSASIEVDSYESNQNHLENENTTTTIESNIQTESAGNEIEMRGMIESGIEEVIENVIENEIKNEILELEKESMTQQEFERSLEQFWNCDEEIPSRYTSETELGVKANKKKKKFRIPKSKSTLNFSNVKSRYLDVFKKI